MDNHTYQYDFSRLQPGDLYDPVMRTQKANKIIAVLKDYYQKPLNSFTALDIGCSTGITTHVLSQQFKSVVGIDIDEAAISFAQKKFAGGTLLFMNEDIMRPSLADETFDVIICSHVYEHVPNAMMLMRQIWRLLKPHGVCFFAAPNRLVFLEAHYHLPFLSLFPRRLADSYVRLFRRGDYYYEHCLTLWQLRKLVKKFEILDYTSKVIADPRKYFLTEMITPGSFKQRIARFSVNVAYWLCPVYIWLLRKNQK